MIDTIIVHQACVDKILAVTMVLTYLIISHQPSDLVDFYFITSEKYASIITRHDYYKIFFFMCSSALKCWSISSVLFSRVKPPTEITPLTSCSNKNPNSKLLPLHSRHERALHHIVYVPWFKSTHLHTSVSRIDSASNTLNVSDKFVHFSGYNLQNIDDCNLIGSLHLKVYTLMCAGF